MDKIAAIEEWVAATVDDGRVRLSLGDQQTADGTEEYFVTLTPDGAMALALELLEKAYVAQGEEVERILVLLNPEMETPKEEVKPEDLPS